MLTPGDIVLEMQTVAFLTASILVLPCAFAFAPPQLEPPSSTITIQIIEGEGAINNVKRGTAFEPVIEVRNGKGEPVAGASVTFTLPAIGPSGVFPDGAQTLVTRTDENGRAAARGMRPNNIPGQFEIRVTASDGKQSTTATFMQTNAAPATVDRGSGRKWLILVGIVGGAAAAGLVAAHGGGGSAPQSNPAAAAPPAGSVTPGAPGFGAPR
jgi:hypothetical protein